ncbi:M20/M25/M40 family metallo-hydrolase [Sediminibacterium sp.]|uniref:M20/M25/M40 family metallo-hydrolase n=1 Tax=Sediminibacterium sp. TaxID=1917865 RepID=UPI00271FEBD3|nr:M20/M25/M40 family metallo-hydrolase [Sediminibacterium sp.]MDO9155688.1 M20/M25/M40 family metallo-hydrolase [Sediminibacterium sp.]MDP2420025.1 M20/M25/M40 family metallo-hydrolase [Sediminibacterium sp.]
MKQLFILAAFIPMLASAQNNADSVYIKKISDEIMRNGKAHDLLRELTKGIGGRLAGSVQYTKAVQWGEASLKKLGADKVYLQECMMPNWKRGGKDQATVVIQNGKKTNRSLDVLALGNSLGTGGKPLVAEVIAVQDFDEMEAKKDQLKGKIVYFNNKFNPTNIQTFKSYGEAGQYRRSGPSRAAKYGAVGVMIRSLTEATDNNPHTGTTGYDEAYPKIPAIALGNEDADFIWSSTRNSSIKVSMTTNGSFGPDVVGHSVVAELTGTEFPNEYITVGGHLDSWDVNEGAHDDGAGIVQTIEIMRALKVLGYKPKRTLRFVLFANEENGMRGGNKYAEEAKKNNEKHVFALESDAGGFTPRGFGFTVSAAQLTKIQSWLPLLKPYGTDFLQAGGGGADIGPLNRTFGTPIAGLMPDSQRYFDIHHARSDVFENVNKRELNLGAVNMAALIYLVDQYGL